MLADVSDGAPTLPAGSGNGKGRWARRLGWLALIAAGAVALFCAARLADRQMGTQSDGASQVLEAWAMWHGNPLLHGWYLSDVSFYTTELPEYVIVTVFRGLRPDVVNICSALTYALIVVLAAAVAYGSVGLPGGSSSRTGTTEKRAGLAGAVITVAVLLGPLPAATSVLLNDPDHVGSVVPVLLAFLLASRVLDGRQRSSRRRWLLTVGVAAVLAVAMVGDPLIQIFGTGPVVLVFGSSAAWRLAVRRQPLADVLPELSLAAAGLAAAAAGAELARLIPAVGGYQLGPISHRYLLPLSVLPSNAGPVGKNFLLLFSAWFSDLHAHAWLPAVTAVHLVFACLVVASLALVLLRVFRRDDLIARLLATAIVANVAAYALLYQVQPSNVREIGPVFGLGGALAGRVLGERVVRWRPERLLPVVAVAALAALVPPLLTVVPSPSAAANVAAFLASHQLRSGLGGYWQANIITVETGGQVTVLPVRRQAGTILAPFRWELDSSKLSDPGHQANFMVVTSPGDARSPGGGDNVTEQDAIKMFGEPTRVYRLSPGFAVLVWHENLLGYLDTGMPAPKNGHVGPLHFVFKQLR